MILDVAAPAFSKLNKWKSRIRGWMNWKSNERGVEKDCGTLLPPKQMPISVMINKTEIKNVPR